MTISFLYLTRAVFGAVPLIFLCVSFANPHVPAWFYFLRSDLLCLSLSVESGLTYTQSEMGVDGESGWRVVMTSQTVGRLPALSRPAKMTQRQTTTETANQSSDMHYGESQRLKRDERRERSRGTVWISMWPEIKMKEGNGDGKNIDPC